MNAILDALRNPLAERLGWGLIHLLWQGAAVAVLLAGVLWLLRKRSANGRYVCAGIALLLLPAAFAVTFALLPAPVRSASIDRATRKPISAAVSNGESSVAEGNRRNTVAVSTPQRIASQPEPPRPTAGGRRIRENSAVRPLDSRILTNSATEAPLAPDSATPSATPAPGASGLLVPTSSSRRPPLQRRIAGRIEPALPWIVGGWLAGLIVLSLWRLGGWLALWRLRHRGVSPVSDSARDAMNGLCRRFGIRRSIAVLQSTRVSVPSLLGFLKPVVLLPGSVLTGLTPSQLEAVLAHELAHVRRHDYLLNLLQTAIETLLFFHPAVWWMSRRIRTERENCCDDLAIQVCGDRVGYARALTELAGLRSSSGLAMAATGSRRLLLPRIRRILGLSARQNGQSGAWSGVALVVLCFGIVVGYRATANQEAEQDRVQANTSHRDAADAKPVWKALPGVGLGQIGNVCFVDEQRAWMTTSDGSLLKSVDGAKTWHTVPLQRGDDAWNPLLVRLLKRSNGTCFGWAVSGTGHIYHTADGEAWARQKSPFSNVKHRIGCLDVLDENHAWVSGYGLNWRTTDGGKTWEHLSPKLQKDKTLPRWFSGDEEHRLIHFRDKQHGTAIFLTPHSTAGWGTRTTSDGGKTWKTRTRRFKWKTKSTLTVLRSGRALRVYTDGGTLIYGHGEFPIDGPTTARLLARKATADGEPILRGWDRQYFIVSRDLFAAVEMVRSVIRSAGASLKSLRISNDRGKHWSRRFVSSKPSALRFTDRHHGWAVGTGGRVSRTTDGGETWSTQFLPTNTDFRSVCFADAKTGWIGGRSQAPEADAPKTSPSAPIWRTDDGGRTWKRIAQIEPGLNDTLREEINRLLFSNRREGWAVTQAMTTKPHPETNGATPLEYGRILHTLDGGRTWKQVYYGTPLKNIARRGRRWCAVGYGAVISSDGKTWKNAGSGTLFGVAFVDRDKVIEETEVIAVGESGGYMRSTNGGLDWKPEKRDALRGTHLDVVTFAGPDTGWIAGSAAPDRHSGLFKTTDGGKSWNTAEIVWPARFEKVIRHHFQWSDLSAADATHAWGIGGSYGQAVVFRLGAAEPKPRAKPRQTGKVVIKSIKGPWKDAKVRVFRVGRKTAQLVAAKRAIWKLSAKGRSWKRSVIAFVGPSSGLPWVGLEQGGYLDTGTAVYGFHTIGGRINWHKSIVKKDGKAKAQPMAAILAAFDRDFTVRELEAFNIHPSHRTPLKPHIKNPWMFTNGKFNSQLASPRITGGKFDGQSLKLDLTDATGKFKAAVWIDVKSKKVTKVEESKTAKRPKVCEAIYLVRRGKENGQLSVQDLKQHPDVLEVHTFAEFARQAHASVALWVDKNAVGLVNPEWLRHEPQLWYPLAVIGYCNAQYAFHEKLRPDPVPFRGPRGVKLPDWTKVKLTPGFSVWHVSPGGLTVLRGYDGHPTVARVLKVTNALLEQTTAPSKIESAVKPIDLGRKSVRLETHPADKNPAKLFAVGPYVTKEVPTAQGVYLWRLNGKIKDGYYELVGRMRGDFDPGGNRFEAERFERIGNTIRGVIRRIDREADIDGPNVNVFVRAALPALPAGKYRAEISFRDVTFQGRRRIVAKTTHDPISCTFEVPANVEFSAELKKLAEAAVAIKPGPFLTPPTSQQSTGLDLSKLLKLTGQDKDRASFPKDHQHFRAGVSALVKGKKTWALCALLDHPNVDAKILAARGLKELGDANSVPVLLAAAKRNRYFAIGSEGATLHTIYRRALKAALEKTSGLQLTPKGLKTTITGADRKPRIVHSDDHPEYFAVDVDFPKVESWLRTVYLADTNAAGGADDSSTDNSKPQILVRRTDTLSDRPLAVSPDGKRFAVAGRDSRIGIYSTEGGKAGTWLAGHVGPVTCLDWSPDGKWIVSGSYDKAGSFPQKQDGTIRVWNVSTGKETHRLARMDSSGVADVRFSPDGTAILARNHSGRVGMWSARTGRKLASFSGFRDARFAADGAGVLVSSGLDVSRMTFNQQVNGSQRIVKLKAAAFTLAPSPDGKSFATGAVREIAIWDLKTGKQRVKLPWTGHRPVSIAFSPDGKILATLVEDVALPSGSSPPLVLHFWDATTGKRLQTIRGERLRSFRWFPDGRSVLTTSADGSVRRWTVSTGGRVGKTSPPRRAAESAASRIEKLGMAQHALLLRQLKSTNPALRAAATLKLDNVELLARQLLDSDGKVRSAATYRILEIGASAVPELQHLRKTDDLKKETRSLIDGILEKIESRRSAEVPEGKPRVNPLNGMAWLVGGEWVTRVPTPGGEIKTFVTTFEWDARKRTIKSKHVLREKGREFPTAQSTYWWDPVKKQIRVLSISLSEGSAFAEGTVTIAGETVKTELTISGDDGKTFKRRISRERKNKDTMKSTAFILRDGKWTAAGVQTIERMSRTNRRLPIEIRRPTEKSVIRSVLKQTTSPKDRGTLSDLHEKVRKGEPSRKDEPVVVAGPKPRDLTPAEWFKRGLKTKGTLSAGRNVWLLYRSKQVNDNDRMWVSRVSRRGNDFTVWMQRAILNGEYGKNGMFHEVHGINLGKIPAGEYTVKWKIRRSHFKEFDRQRWPKDEKPAKDAELETSFRVVTPRASAIRTDGNGLQLRATAPAKIERGLPLAVKLQWRCDPAKLPAGVKRLNTFLHDAFLELRLTDRRTGKTVTISPYDPTFGMPAWDNGKSSVLLNGKPIPAWKVVFPLATGYASLGPGQSECRVKFTFPKGKTSWWRGTAAQWRAAGFWHGSVVSPAFSLKITADKHAKKKLLLPKRLRVETQLLQLRADNPKKTPVPVVVFRRKDAEEVAVPVRNGYTIAAKYYLNGKGFMLTGPPRPDDVNAIDEWRAGEKTGTYTIEVFETSERAGHLWHPGPGRGGYKVLWKKTFEVSLEAASTEVLKQVKTPNDRGTLRDAYQKVLGGKPAMRDELKHVPPLERMTKGETLANWFTYLRMFQCTTNDNNWLMFRSKQMNANDRMWIERVERRGSNFTVTMKRAIWLGDYKRNTTFHEVYGVNLGKRPAGKYTAKWIIRESTFKDFDKDGAPKNGKPAKKKPVELTTSFEVRTAVAWNKSSDGVLALRLENKTPKVTVGGYIKLAATLRNLSKKRVDVLKPFGDDYAARHSVNIVGKSGRVKYGGPAGIASASYTLGEDAFARLAPGESISGTLKLGTKEFVDFKTPGKYTVTYTYANGRKLQIHSKKLGRIGPVWKGRIVSPTLTVELVAAATAKGQQGAGRRTSKTGVENSSQDAAVAAIKRVGGYVTFDISSPDRPATGVKMTRPFFTDDHLKLLKGLTRLKALDLTNSRVTDAGLAHLKAVRTLQTLNLTKTHISDAGLAHLKALTGLRVLHLTNTGITDTGLKHLAGMVSLQGLHLYGTRVTDAGLAQLKGLPGLKTLILDRTRVTDAGLEHLKNLTSLETLSLYLNQVTDAGLVHLQGLARLKVLYLSGTRITDAGLVHVKGLTNLKRLDLTYAPITDAGLMQLQGLTNLEILSLANTRVTDDGMKRLYGFKKLRTLYVSGTRVSHAGVIALQTALPDCHVDHQWMRELQQPLKATETKQTSNLRITVEGESATFTVGENVTLQLLIKNVGVQPGRAVSPTVHLLLTKPDGKTVSLMTPKGLPIGKRATGPRGTIKVGASTRLKVVLNSLYFVDIANSSRNVGTFLLSKPGRYTLRAACFEYGPFKVPDLQKYPFSSRPAPVRRTLLQSPPVTVTIVARGGQSAPKKSANASQRRPAAKRPADAGQVYVDKSRRFRVTVPKGWSATPVSYSVMHYRDVFLCINSKGNKALRVTDQTRGDTTTYSPETVASQLAPGTAYIDFAIFDGPGGSRNYKGKPDTVKNDLSPLLKSFKPVKAASGKLSVEALSFIKREHRWNIQVYFREPANPELRAKAESLLRSFRFVGTKEAKRKEGKR